MTDDTDETTNDQNVYGLDEKFEDIIASLAILSLIAYIGLGMAGIISFTPVTTTWFTIYALIVIMSATKLYGKKVLTAARGTLSTIVQGAAPPQESGEKNE